MPTVFPQDFGQVECVEVWIAAEALRATGTCQQWALPVWTYSAICGSLCQEFLCLQLEAEGKNIILEKKKFEGDFSEVPPAPGVLSHFNLF